MKRILYLCDVCYAQSKDEEPATHRVGMGKMKLEVCKGHNDIAKGKTNEEWVDTWSSIIKKQHEK